MPAAIGDGGGSVASQEAQEGCFGAEAPTHFQANDDQAAPPGTEKLGIHAVSVRRAAVTERPGSTSAHGWGSPVRVSGETSVASTASCEPCQGDKPFFFFFNGTTSMRLWSATSTSMFLSATRAF